MDKVWPSGVLKLVRTELLLEPSWQWWWATGGTNLIPSRSLGRPESAGAYPGQCCMLELKRDCSHACLFPSLSYYSVSARCMSKQPAKSVWSIQLSSPRSFCISAWQVTSRPIPVFILWFYYSYVEKIPYLREVDVVEYELQGGREGFKEKQA